MINEVQKKIWDLRDEYIERRRAGESIVIGEYCDMSYLSPEGQRELKELLEEYEAAQEGLEKYVASHIDLDDLWDGISQKLAPRRFSLADVLSGSMVIKQNVSDWLRQAYHSLEHATKAFENLASDQMGELSTTSHDGSSSKLHVRIADEHGNLQGEAEFLMETDIEVDPDGELVFSAVAPDESYIGKSVSIEIRYDGRELQLCSPVVEEDGRIEVFLDLYFLGEGIQITRDMIKAQLVDS